MSADPSECREKLPLRVAGRITAFANLENLAVTNTGYQHRECMPELRDLRLWSLRVNIESFATEPGDHKVPCTKKVSGRVSGLHVKFNGLQTPGLLLRFESACPGYGKLLALMTTKETLPNPKPQTLNPKPLTLNPKSPTA